MKFYVFGLLTCLGIHSVIIAEQQEATATQKRQKPSKEVLESLGKDLDALPNYAHSYVSKLYAAAKSGTILPQLALLEAGAKFDQPDLIKKAVKAGADINATSSITGETPLEMSLNSHSDLKAFAEILRQGANVNSRIIKDQNYPPLTTILSSKNSSDIKDNIKEIVKMLLNAGADPKLKNPKGKNAYDYAKGTPELEKILADYDKLQSPEHKKALQAASQKIISGTGPLQAQQTAGKTIQGYLGNF